jgi:cytoskeletal protein CcmA (bactofilin family)
MHKGRDLAIKGDLTATEDITLNFSIDGSVTMPGNRLVVTEDARVKGTVTAASVTIRGHLDGHVSAEHLEIMPSGVVNAGLVTTRLALHDGALFTGAVNTDRAKAAGTVARHRQKT